MAYAIVTDFGSYLVAIDSNESRQADALSAAASLMDMEFDAGGVTTTPIDTSVVESATKKAEFDSLLKWINVAWAARILTTGATGTGKKVLKDAETADAIVKRIVSGAVELPVPYTRLRELVRR